MTMLIKLFFTSLVLARAIVPNLATQRDSNVGHSLIDKYAIGLSRPQCSKGSCQFVVRCKSRTKHRPTQFCTLDYGFTGICCHDQQWNGEINFIPFGALVDRNSLQKAKHSIENDHIETLSSTPRIIQIQKNQIDRFIESLHQFEGELEENEIVPETNTQESAHQHFFASSSQALSEMKTAEKVLQAFINFAKKKHLSMSDIHKSKFDIRKTTMAEFCPPNPSCENKQLYRQPDGTCNNLIDTSQGKAISTFARLLPAEYSDGFNSPRIASDGSSLPNPRLLSLIVALDVPIESDYYSLLLAQFGQFVDHDISRTALTRTRNGSMISCCDERVLSNPRLRHPACLEIPVPEQDLFFRSQMQKCINFVRSSPSISPKCRFGPREQLNQLSSYLDGNQIYGASHEEENKLRSFENGRLNVEVLNDEEFLPSNPNSKTCRIPKELNRKCFLAGDIRLNEVPDLVVLHAIWHREHNRIANILGRINPGWPDEIIFQETKRIVIAELQHIIYNEFLSLILGQNAIEHFSLALKSSYSDDYATAIDPTILNEFATAAYRLHSLVQGELDMNSPDGRHLGKISLENMFSNPEILYEPGVFEIRLAGLTSQAIRTFDSFFSKEITNHLFQIPGMPFGLDLVALNIQRGRDHGIPGYVKYRDICGLSHIKTFSDLKPIFSNPELADELERLYHNVEDIDLFIGGSSERPLQGAIVGPTFACIIGEQFRRIKNGDRFWYENQDMETSFNFEQLTQIKKVTMARILCDNSQLGIMQANAFLMPIAGNSKISCDKIPRLNLKHWIQDSF